MTSEERKSASPKKARIVSLVILCVVACVLWGLNWYLLSTFVNRQDTRGQFGDMFGAVNALFTALAFAGLIYTVLLQRDQLSLQQLENVESRKTQSELVQQQIQAQDRLFGEQKAFQEEQRLKRIAHEEKLEQLRQDFEHLVEDHRKARDIAAKQDFKNNVLKALRCELEALSAVYQEGIGNNLERIQEGDILPVRFVLTEDWLTVFKANASNLGVVDGALSRKIIIVYSLLKLLIEEYRINNTYLIELDAIEPLTASPDRRHLARKEQLQQLARSQAQEIKQADARLKTAYRDLMATLDSQDIA